MLEKIKSVCGYHWAFVLFLMFYCLVLLLANWDVLSDIATNADDYHNLVAQGKDTTDMYPGKDYLAVALKQILNTLRNFPIIMMFLCTNMYAIKRRFMAWLSTIMFFLVSLEPVIFLWNDKADILPVMLVTAVYFGVFFVIVYLFTLLIAKYHLADRFIEKNSNYPEVNKPLLAVILGVIIFVAALLALFLLDDWIIAQHDNIGLLLPCGIIFAILAAICPWFINRYGYVFDEEQQQEK